MLLPRSATPRGACHESLCLAARRLIHAVVALGGVKRARQTFSTSSKGRVILEQQNQVVNDHITKGNSLTNKHRAAFDLGVHGF